MFTTFSLKTLPSRLLLLTYFTYYRIKLPSHSLPFSCCSFFFFPLFDTTLLLVTLRLFPTSSLSYLCSIRSPLFYLFFLLLSYCSLFRSCYLEYLLILFSPYVFLLLFFYILSPTPTNILTTFCYLHTRISFGANCAVSYTMVHQPTLLNCSFLYTFSLLFTIPTSYLSHHVSNTGHVCLAYSLYIYVFVFFSYECSLFSLNYTFSLLILHFFFNNYDTFEYCCTLHYLYPIQSLS